MTARTPAEQALARSYTTGDGALRFEIADLAVDHTPRGTAVLTFWLTAVRPDREDERWVVTLPWDDKSFTDVLTSPAPDAERLQMLVHLVHALLEEWWDTKKHSRRSARMGRPWPPA